MIIVLHWFTSLQGKFTTKTDVWSFGVTLWEILTFAREQPHESQSDAKILSNLSNMWREGRPTIFLSTPHGCPREVRDLMHECWQREEKERPSFREIHLFLQRKNLGFDPQHCQWKHIMIHNRPSYLKNILLSYFIIASAQFKVFIINYHSIFMLLLCILRVLLYTWKFVWLWFLF